jgi:NADPH:quinone reductase-like Zn-dependent oxidoreductase
MRAYVQRGHGGPDVCSFEDRPVPVPGPGEVLLEVEATGLNRLDLLQRQAPLVRGFALPHVAGMDVVGTVVAHGGDVLAANVTVGSRVLVDPVTTCRTCEMCRTHREPYCAALQTIGSTRPGGFAEFVVVPADRCWPVPAHLSPVQAAGVSVAYMTAWQALVTVGKVRPTDVVVVNAANAGVSMAAIQLAKRVGATVIGTVRGAARMPQIIALGCDHVVDSTDPSSVAGAVRTLTDGRGADLIIDHVGPAQFSASVDALGVEGRLVFCGTTTGVRVELSLTDIYWWGRQLLGAGGYRPSDVGLMLDAVTDSALIPVVDEAAPFAELPRLLDRLEHGSVIGKLVVTMR